MATSTQNRLSISLIIPCYNDVDALGQLLTQAETKAFDEIIVVGTMAVKNARDNMQG